MAASRAARCGSGRGWRSDAAASSDSRFKTASSFRPAGGQGYATHARVARRWLGADESLRLEVSQEAAGVARVQGQTGTQLPDLDPVLADFKEDAARAERPGAAEKAPSQCSDLLGHRAIEASHLGDAVHTSDISQRYGRRQASSFLRHGLFSEDLL